MGTSNQYHERLLHWLWQHRQLKPKRLSTLGGKEIRVHHPGYPNRTDGPDFMNARLKIGQLMWHGDVEIHWQAGDWYAHNHHTDANYNRVVLHVIYEGHPMREATCEDGSSPPTLVMKPFLSQPLQHFFGRYQQSHVLPCASSVEDVPEAIIKKQFEQAHDAYFEQKVNDQLAFYEAVLPLSQAWVQMLGIALFDALGISHNRQPMRKLAIQIMAEDKTFKTPYKLSTYALKTAGIEPADKDTTFTWKYKGSRPANHPKARIKQGCDLLFYIKQKSFKKWLHADIKASFQTMLKHIQTNPGIGSHQAGVLLGTVWLPAFYLLGDLTGTQALRQQTKEYWSTHRTKLPQSITRTYQKAEFPEAAFKQKLGTVHQYRSYCKARRCDQCAVFNNIISP